MPWHHSRYATRILYMQETQYLTVWKRTWEQSEQ